MNKARKAFVAAFTAGAPVFISLIQDGISPADVSSTVGTALLAGLSVYWTKNVTFKYSDHEN